MSKRAFQPGDRVEFTDMVLHRQAPNYYPRIGTVGTVVLRNDEDCDVYVQWPKGTTSLDDRWWASPDTLRFVGRKASPYRNSKERRVGIFVDPKDPRKIVALDMRNGKSAEARCNPEDTFDFYVGASLALSRLAAKDFDAHEPKFKVGDIIIGNDKAKKYGITSTGWVGVVTEVYRKPHEGHGCDDGKNLWFRAKKVNDLDDCDYILDEDAFDLA